MSAAAQALAPRGALAPIVEAREVTRTLPGPVPVTLVRDISLADLGLSEPSLDRVTRASYDLLRVISFFTVGEDEVRAWTVRRGSRAREAAGAVHSDIERGFIRAEVTPYEDLRRLGSMKEVKAKGKQRLEGKEYEVADGDILNIRFSV